MQQGAEGLPVLAVHRTEEAGTRTVGWCTMVLVPLASSLLFPWFLDVKLWKWRVLSLCPKEVQGLLVLDCGLVCQLEWEPNVGSLWRMASKEISLYYFPPQMCRVKNRSAVKYNLSFLSFLVLCRPLILTHLFERTSCWLPIKHCSRWLLCDFWKHLIIVTMYLYIHVCHSMCVDVKRRWWELFLPSHGSQDWTHFVGLVDTRPWPTEPSLLPSANFS